MEPKEILLELRTKHGLSQEQLAEKVHVTRQAVSRWETGETVPNTETLKLLSSLFDVSINTLLGSPRQLICAAVCPWRTPISAGRQTALLTKSTASGATLTENLFIRVLRNCCASWRIICPMKPGLLNRSEPTSKPNCQN